MAREGPVQNLCEETTCSICLEYFTDPVIIECGHIFCQTCITKAWGKSDGEASCPQCREPCKQRNFRPNRQLASIVEIAKKFSLQVAKGAEALGRFCERHQEPLKLFCEDDQAPICVVCDKSKEHRGHKVIPEEEAFEEYQGKILHHLELLNKQRREILFIKRTVESASQNLMKAMEMERQKIMADFKQLHQFLNEQECLLLDQLKKLDDGIKSHKDQNTAKFSEEMSPVDNLIKELEEKQKQPANEFLQNMRSILERCNENENKTVNGIDFPPGLQEQIEKFSQMHRFLEKETQKFKDIVLSGPQEKKDTAAPCLRFEPAQNLRDPDPLSQAFVFSRPPENAGPRFMGSQSDSYGGFGGLSLPSQGFGFFRPPEKKYTAAPCFSFGATQDFRDPNLPSQVKTWPFLN